MAQWSNESKVAERRRPSSKDFFWLLMVTKLYSDSFEVPYCITLN
jgi:hypothetical protein